MAAVPFHCLQTASASFVDISAKLKLPVSSTTLHFLGKTVGFSTSDPIAATFTKEKRQILRRRPVFCEAAPRRNDEQIIVDNNTDNSEIKTRMTTFSDGRAEVELRIDISDLEIENTRDIHVDTDDLALRIRVRSSGTITTIMEASNLYDRIKPSETIWYIDENELVLSLKKREADLIWPDLTETWSSLTSGVSQLLKGTSVYIVGSSSVINQAVAKELASGLGYAPLDTSELLERYAQQSIHSWVAAEGEASVVEAESAVLQSISSHARTVVATLGGQHGAAASDDKWRHLYSGFTIWLSESEVVDEAAAKEEALKDIQDGNLGYSNADVVVKFRGWESDSSRTVAQACLNALKRLLLSDMELTGKKSLYIRLGCRGDWPNIKPPGWDPSVEGN